MWPIALEQPLPAVAVPLLPGDPEASLDLQQALKVIYDIFGYDDLLDCRRPPPGPLTPTQAHWIQQRLLSAGRIAS